MPDEDTLIRVIVKYNGEWDEIEERLREEWGESIKFVRLFQQYAIIILPVVALETLEQLSEIEYIELPKEVYFNLQNGRNRSCLVSVQRVGVDGLPEGSKNLTGRGVLIGIIDSGIDYTHPAFQNEEGESRIQYLWDQTAPDEGNELRRPSGYSGGAEYTQEEITEALKESNPERRETMVPVSDRESGHGTAVAGVAAGNGAGSASRRYRGIATESELIVVKLGIAGEGFARTTEVMEAIDYVIRKAIELNRPIAINLSFGNNDGAHNGESLFESYITDVSGIWKNVICVASGNEGDARHHLGLYLKEKSIYDLENISNNKYPVKEIAIAVAENEKAFTMQIWKKYQDDFMIEIESPGLQTLRLVGRPGRGEEYLLGASRLQVFYGEPSPYTETQEIRIEWFPREEGIQTIEEGIWRLRFYPQTIKSGEVNMWLPTIEAIGASTGFLRPTPNTTLTIPSTARKIISVGAYNAINDTIPAFSGRGETADERLKPTLVAPGVDVITTIPGGGYAAKTGTSIAAPFVTGSAALLMEWGDGVIIRLS